MGFAQGEEKMEKKKGKGKGKKKEIENAKYWVSKGNDFCKVDKYREAIECYEKAIKCYEKIIQQEPKNASVYNSLGNTFFKLAKINKNENLFRKAFEKYEKATELEQVGTKKAIAFHNWGNAFYKLAENKKEKERENLLNDASKKYDKATKLAPKNATTFRNLGVTLFELAKIKLDNVLFQSALKKYEKAAQLYKTGRCQAIVFNNWGLTLSYLAEIKQDNVLFQSALKKHKKATRLDPKNTSAIHNLGIALYDLAEIKQDKNLYGKAVECFIKSKQDILRIFVSLYKDNKKRKFQPEYFYKLLDNNEFFLKSIEKDKTKLNEYKDIYLISIFIISQLHITNENENLVAYYREKNISQKLLFDNNSKFRLNAINYSNDPTEGKTLLDFLYGEKNRPTNKELNTEYEAFAGCFTFNYDSLNQFRLYGKEDGKEGTGLSLVFKDSFFNKDAKMAYESNEADLSIMETDNEPTETDLGIKENKSSLFRCIYLDPNTETKQSIVTVGQKEEYLFYREGEIEEKFVKYNEEMNIIIKGVRKEMKYLKDKAKNLDPAIVGKLLIHLRYLVKHIAFKEEQECRIVKIHNLNDNEIEMKDEYKQMYINYSPSVQIYIDRIYFGPKAGGIELFKNMLKNKKLEIPCEKSTNPFA